jgi:hypothetical protein
MRILLAALFFYVISTSAMAATINTNLCDQDENVIFSCSLKKKQVSLCASGDLKSNTGRLFYRFGVAGKQLELVHPSNKDSPFKAFSTYFDGSAKSSESNVAFKQGGYMYVIYNRLAAFEIDDRSNGGGIMVYRNGKQISDMWCVDKTINDNIYESLHGLAFPVASIP